MSKRNDQHRPSDEDTEWFCGNHYNLNFEKASDKVLRKFYHLATYFKHNHIFTRKSVQNGMKIHLNKEVILGNMEVTSQILNSRISKRAFWVSLSALGFAISAVVFSFMDYQGDKEWQQEQLKLLNQINETLKVLK